MSGHAARTDSPQGGKPRNLLTRGNRKLGESIHAWSIPAVDTCPGRSPLCERLCYARSGHFRLEAVQQRLEHNLDAALAGDFERRLAAEVRRRRIHTVRMHVTGDFFSPEYTRKWLRIARRCPQTTFYGSTRSWRVPDLAPALAELAALENVRLWFSADPETGMPTRLPLGVEVAYLQSEAGEAIPEGVGVIFRVRRLRQERRWRVGLAVVCPTETGRPGAAEHTCTSCGRCFDHQGGSR
jgi:hypothetical protein